ncbi:HEPN domain-containing protein [Geoalkalibacter halelectricus]|uniref:HEPN domain-containing protein n=1 Tax=Geoalkalibacter halelectricus TaxID=2847045 RepID=A0ABY5ZQ09_9BACT|nr:HEPN domain-containing protein [Geoalkalibacter halelectricus]UWZ79789.1 HEPN domain-containing protein [Geoalkalibacter halelectricus]
MNPAAREWLAKAREDFLAVEKLADDDDLSNVAAFHAQQCAEKSLKAVLEASGQKVPRTHDLIRLISPDLAVRLERAGVSTARFWMTLQANYDLSQALKREQPPVKPLAA